MRAHRRLSVLVGMLVLFGQVPATAQTEVPSPSPLPLHWESAKSLAEVSGICVFSFQVAAGQDAPDLSQAIRACASLDEWVTASAAYPGALSGSAPLDVVVGMCSDEALGLAQYTLCHGVRSALLMQASELATAGHEQESVEPVSLESAAQAYLAVAIANLAAREPIETLRDAAGDDMGRRAEAWAADAAQNEAFIDGVTALDLPPNIQPRVDGLVNRTRLVANLERMLSGDPQDSDRHARWQAAREARHEAALEVRRVLGLPPPWTESNATGAIPSAAAVSVDLVFEGNGFEQVVKGLVPDSDLSWCEWGTKPGSSQISYVDWIVFDGRELGVPWLGSFSFKDIDGPGRLRGRAFFDVANGLDTRSYAWSPVLAAKVYSRGKTKYRDSHQTVVLDVKAMEIVGSGAMTVVGKISCRPGVAAG